MQPAELLIIGGAAIGTVLIANPLHILKKIVPVSWAYSQAQRFTKQRYLETLKMMYDLLEQGAQRRPDGAGERRRGARKEPDLLQISQVSERPSRSRLSSATPCAWPSPASDPFDLDQMMELDMEVHHHEAVSRSPR